MEKKFQDIITQAKSAAFLDKEEKAFIRSHLISFMKAHSIQTAGGFQARGFFPILAVLWSRPAFKYGMPVLTMAILFGFGGVSFTANRAMPGEFLYPVKIEVNEKVLAFFAGSEQARAKLSIGLTDARLQEFEKIALVGKLNDLTKSQAKSSFDSNFKDAQMRIKQIEFSHGATVSAELNSLLESTLNSHAKIIGKISKSPDGKADQIGAFAKEVISHRDITEKSRKDSEEKLLKEKYLQIKLIANAGHEKAKSRIKNLQDFISDNNSEIPTDDYQSAQISINEANNLLMQGEDKLAKEHYQEAFLLFNRAAGLAEEVKISVKSSIILKIDIAPENLHFEKQDDNPDKISRDGDGIKENRKDDQLPASNLPVDAIEKINKILP